MATLELPIPSSAGINAVTLLSLADASTNAPITLPAPATFTSSAITGGNLWSITYAAPNSIRVAYSVQFNYSAGGTSTTASIGLGDLASGATGDIIDQTGLTNFLNASNLAILSSSGLSVSTIDPAIVQNAIDAAEGRIRSRLSVVSIGGVKAFKNPLTVGGIIVRLASGSIAKPVLQLAGYQYATRFLDSWRAILSTPDPDDNSNTRPFTSVTRAWEKTADAEMDRIVLWATGSIAGGTAVDLDLTDGVALGSADGVFQSVSIVSSCGCGDEWSA